MSYLAERVAYLQGLAEGMKLDEKSNEGKLLLKIIDVLEDTANAIGEIVEIQDEMQLQLDDVDDDLAALEEDLYDDDECCDCDCDCCDDYDDFEDDYEYEMVECPNCHEEICLDEDLISEDGDSFICPSCNERIEIEFEDCDCDDCE